jgi:lipoprotein-releasing system permease protein
LNASYYIAKRYLIAKSSNNTINIITKIATVGIIIGTIALFIVLSAFSGLKSFNIFFVNTSDPDLKITSVKGKSFFYTDSINDILKHDKIAQFSKVIEENAMFVNHTKEAFAIIKGVDSKYLSVNNLDTAIVIGEWLKDKHDVVVGGSISDKISVIPNAFQDDLKAFVIKPGRGQLKRDSYNEASVQTTAILRLTQDFDEKYVFASLDLVKDLLNYKTHQISGIEIKLKSDKDTKAIQTYLKTQLGNSFKVQTREQLNAVMYKMLNLENLFTYLISTLIVIIALFNVIGAIIMMVLDKRKDLHTLFNLGLSIKKIRSIFTLQGFLLTVFGLIVGLIIAIVFVLLQIKFEFFMLTESIAYPMEFYFKNVVIVVLTILSLGGIAALIASNKINKKMFN